jgi:hypothetical protein
MHSTRRKLLWALLAGAGGPRALAATCRPTETNSFGPFYRDRAPFRHVHCIASHPSTREPVTQMYFSGAPHLETDWLVRDSLVMDRIGDPVRFDIELRT